MEHRSDAWGELSTFFGQPNSGFVLSRDNKSLHLSYFGFLNYFLKKLFILDNSCGEVGVKGMKTPNTISHNDAGMGQVTLNKVFGIIMRYP